MFYATRLLVLEMTKLRAGTWTLTLNEVKSDQLARTRRCQNPALWL